MEYKNPINPNHNHYKHGGHRTRLYKIWKSMRERCNTTTCSGYKKYGAKGIRICGDWNDFENFRTWAMSNGYEECLTIDRIDFKGDYCPSNCRWVDVLSQNNNRSSNVYVEFDGESLTFANFCRKYGLNYKRAWQQYRRDGKTLGELVGLPFN